MQDGEITRDAEITQQTGVAICFCDPHSPWRRGSNENINDLIRLYLPKGTDLSIHTQADLEAIAYQLNIRLRKRFDFRCTIEVITDVVLSANINEEKSNRCTQSLQPPCVTVYH